MTNQPSTLYAKLLGETAKIGWQELQPSFARGAVLRVDAALDLVSVAEALAENQGPEIAAWLESGQLQKVDETQALDYLARDPDLWAVVVAPWVVIQERD
jgi:hypothetical protein